MNLFERYGTRFLEVLLECSPFGVISQRHLPVHRLPRHFGTNHFIVCQTVHLTVDHDAPSWNRRLLLIRAASFPQKIFVCCSRWSDTLCDICSTRRITGKPLRPVLFDTKTTFILIHVRSVALWHLNSLRSMNWTRDDDIILWFTISCKCNVDHQRNIMTRDREWRKEFIVCSRQRSTSSLTPVSQVVSRSTGSVGMGRIMPNCVRSHQFYGNSLRWHWGCGNPALI